ncbi:hypothetical protein TrVE_jg10981 [Triparma verrucosa]|uniref:WW domain-containing protein n=1 Tax=Triparma verrucosa TaxID=1606542 RepID=A0A9W7FN17_9STRA|nr:hypothetical protein TrVE_jg10981 [Triparma verrucosa]
MDKSNNEVRDAIVRKVHFDDEQPYYTISFVGEEGSERQTTRARLTKKWAPVEEEEEEEEEEAPPRLEWTRYKDERGHNYYYNNRTGASTYMNPYAKRPTDGDESSDDDEEEVVFELPKDPDLLGFLVFCAILVQKHFRGNLVRKIVRERRCEAVARRVQARARGMLGRNFARRMFAKQIRKTFEGGSWIYEDVTTKQIFFERPVIFKFLFPNSTF